MTARPLEPQEPEGPTAVQHRPAPDESGEPEGEPSAEAETEISIPPQRRLVRSRDDRVIGGVCGGLGKYLGVDPVLTRIAALLLVFAGGAGIVLYVVGWIAIPEESEGTMVPTAPAERETADRTRSAVALGLIFIALGALFLADAIWPD
jgi:phage shock protein C